MNKKLNKIWNIITTSLLIIVVILVLLLVGVRLFGIQVYTVLSGSMEPTYKIGSVVYVKAVDYQALEAGDVITFMMAEDTIVTHRIVDILSDQEDASTLRFQTKGDANNTIDGGLIHYKNVLGKPVFSIPKLGYLVYFIQRPPGVYLALAFGMLLLVLVFIPDLLADQEKEKNKSKKKPNKDKSK